MLETPFTVLGLETYDGGKGASGTYQTLINYIPPHTDYVEPFAGSGTIARYKKVADVTFLFDLDKDVITHWKRWIVQSPNRVMQFRTLNKCGIDFLESLADYPAMFFGKTLFIFIDPPYLRETRKQKAPLYKHELTKEEHIRILTGIKNSPHSIMITAYENDLYNKYLKDWNQIPFYNQTHQGRVKEMMYINYEVPDILHDYRYLGIDFTDRQRIKRKIDRWVKGLLKLDPKERNAIIQSIKSRIK